MANVKINALSGLCNLELRAATGYGKRIGWDRPNFATHLHFEPVFEKHLHHKTAHYLAAWSAVRSRVDIVALGIDPGWASVDGYIQPWGHPFTVRKLDIRDMEKIHHSLAFEA